MDPYNNLHWCLRGLALFAILGIATRAASDSLLSYHVLRLWTDDYQNHTCSLNPAAISVLDRHAGSAYWGSCAHESATPRVSLYNKVTRTVVSTILLCVRGNSIFPLGIASYQQYMQLPRYQLPYHGQMAEGKQRVEQGARKKDL